MSGFPNYCSSCGSELGTRHIEGRERAYCSQCDEPIYRNAKPCAGAIIVDDERALLVKRTNPPAVGSWSIPAGFLELEETPEEAAARELFEETGLSVSDSDLELFETNLVSHGNGIYVLVVIYRTTRARVTGTINAGSDAEDAQFWNVDELRECGESIEEGYEPIIRRAISSD